jgi:DNA-binding NtrC family response regulator
VPGSEKRQHGVAFTAVTPVLVSQTMRRLDKVLQLVAAKDVTLTFIGESGAGKEVLARRAHDLSPRRRGPFIPINCAAIPEALFESELFGHERGSFTGANQRATGKIEAAEGGTLFFDEIGEMPMGMQAKLLRFLEHRRFMRVGGVTKLQADVRLLFATLRPLDQDVSAGRFRADLYYRIQGITLEVPPLRERRPDIPGLVKQAMTELSVRHGMRAPRLTREVRALLLAHDWPGNVRELRNLIETVCLLRAGRPVRRADLPATLRAAVPAARAAIGATGPAETVVGADGTPVLTLPLDRPLEALVDDIVAATLEAEGGNRARAATRLGISLRTVQRLLAAGRVADSGRDTVTPPAARPRRRRRSAPGPAA